MKDGTKILMSVRKLAACLICAALMTSSVPWPSFAEEVAIPDIPSVGIAGAGLGLSGLSPVQQMEFPSQANDSLSQISNLRVSEEAQKPLVPQKEISPVLYKEIENPQESPMPAAASQAIAGALSRPADLFPRLSGELKAASSKQNPKMDRQTDQVLKHLAQNGQFAQRTPGSFGTLFDGNAAANSTRENAANAIVQKGLPIEKLHLKLPAAARWQGLAGAAPPVNLGNISPSDVAREKIGDGAAPADAYSQQNEQTRNLLRPLVKWLVDFHLKMRQEFPKADFSMRDFDVLLRYLRVMRAEKGERADPENPGKKIEFMPGMAQVAADALGYIYRDRVGLANPEKSDKREESRRKFDAALALHIKDIPKITDEDFRSAPLGPSGMKLPKPYFQLQKEYFEIFPELAAKAPAADVHSRGFIRSEKNLPTIETRIQQIKTGISLRDPLLLMGDSAVSKSFLIKAYYDTVLNPALAALGKAPISVLPIGVKPNLGSRDLVGRYAPRPLVDENGNTAYANEFAFLAGHLVRGMILGQALVLEEITNAMPEFLEVINFYMTHGYLIIHQKGGKPFIVYPHPNFRIFATGNWTHFAGRNAQSQAFWSRWRVKIWEEYGIEETGYILAAKYGIEEGLARMMVLFQQAVLTELQARKIGKDLQGQYALNLRTLERLCGRFKEDVERLGGKSLSAEDRLKVLGKEIFDEYGAMLPSQEDKVKLLDLMDKTFKLPKASNGQVVTFSDLKMSAKDFEPEIIGFEDKAGELVITEKVLGELRFPKGPGGEMVPGAEHRLTMVPEVTTALFRLLRAWMRREPYLLMGERAAGKTRIVYFAAHLLDMPVLYIAHSQESSLKELIGGYYPRPDSDKDSSKNDVKLPPMVWMDGKEIQAMEWGKGQIPSNQIGAWLFEDDVNLGSVHEHRNTVLDDGVQSTPYREARSGPNFWSVQAVNPPDPMRYAGRKMLSPAHLSRRHVSWQAELDNPKTQEGQAKKEESPASLIEMALDRLVGAVRSQKPLP
ncbi:MAG: AAA family ATPase [Elusimicrobiota bacterium]